MSGCECGWGVVMWVDAAVHVFFICIQSNRTNPSIHSQHQKTNHLTTTQGDKKVKAADDDTAAWAATAAVPSLLNTRRPARPPPEPPRPEEVCVECKCIRVYVYMRVYVRDAQPLNEYKNAWIYMGDSLTHTQSDTQTPTIQPTPTHMNPHVYTKT